MKRLFKFLSLALIIILSFWGYLYINYRAPILMYHSLDKERLESYAAVSPETFRRQMKFIKDRGYQVLSLEDYCQLLEEKKYLPRNMVIITFDDGYKDNLEAAKILNEFEFGATFFLVADNIGKKGFLARRDINWILNNTDITIGSHTLTHAYLPKLDVERLQKEIKLSKEKLEKIFKINIMTFAYPVGGFDKRALKEVKSAGYSCACTTNRGFSRKLDLGALRRIKITERDNNFKLWAKLSGFYNIFKKLKKPY